MKDPAKDRDQSLRESLLELLGGESAHASFDNAVADFPEKLRGAKPEGAPHSAWQLVEHLRIAQWDILEFSRNPRHVSPEFPSGYWPASGAPPTPKDWDKSLAAFRSGLEAMKKLIGSSSSDLYARIPHGDGQTLLREALLVADHNAYHVGQLILLRRLLGAWKNG